MADARRPPPPRRHAPRSLPPPRRPAPRSSPPPGQPAVRSPAAVVRPYPSAPPPGRPREPDPRRPADAAAGRPGGAGAFPLGARRIQAVGHDHRRGAAAPGAPRRRARPHPCAPLPCRRVAAAAGWRPAPPPRRRGPPWAGPAARTAGGDAEAVRRDPDAAAQVQEQRVVQLPRRRRGPQAARLHGHTCPFCGVCSSAAMAGAAVGDSGRRRRAGRRRRDEEATRKGRRGCLPFLLGIGEMLLGIEKKYRGKGDKKSICWSKFFHHQSLILRKGGKKGENQSVGVALSGQTPHPQTSHLHS